MNTTRRTFLKASLGATGGLILSLYLPEARSLGEPTAFTPNAFISIGRDGLVTLTMSFVEMGQGSYTSVTMLIAEELEVDLTSVKLVHAPADEARYAHPTYHMQLTGGSSTVRAAWMPMRQAGAAVRMMLVAAAADQWKVAADSCTASRGQVLHAASGRRLSYGTLSALAALMPVPAAKDIVLKPVMALELAGKSTHRLDTPSKVNGSAVFGIDVQVPGMKIAAVAACPVFGGRLASVDAAPAMKIRGVRQVVKLDNAVAVIADHNWAARTGLAALDIKWDEGANAKFSTEEWLRQLEQAGKTKGRIALDEGRPPQEGRRIDAVYHAPLMAHATMEPMNCTVLVGKDGAEIWTGTQAPARAQALVADALKLDPAKVTVNNHYIGGGFGRRLDADYVVQAALIARQVNYPVKMIWSREEDMQHGQYRPYYRDELSATVDAAGLVTGFSHRVIGSSVRARYAPAWLKDGLDTDAVAAAESLYDIGHKYVEYCVHESPIPSGFWRGVGPTHNTFVVESFIDELAAAANADPLAYRLAMLGKQPRARAALAMVAQKAGWSTVNAPGTGMGLSVISWWGSAAACVVQCAVGGDGQVSLKRVVIVVDCGFAVNPDGVVSQIEGGAIYALSAALYGKLTVENGRIAQSNFHDYPVLRMNEMPIFETHIVPSSEPPGGVGELGTAVLGPALANAVFAASGKRTRTLPVV